jgi:hypothetical protein
MPSEETCIPGAQLMESMRAVGYSLATAIADIVDNSLAAEASAVSIQFSMDVEEPFLAILDDGKGMSAERARDAMRLAGTGTNIQRGERDLGRFGLGLKTASLSQCRRLTVVTKSAGVTTGLVWDLDHLLESERWSIVVLDEIDMDSVPEIESLRGQPHGTLVVWTKLDRIHEQAIDVSAEFDRQMVEARDHLSLIFHQFLNGDSGLAKIGISINSVPLVKLDPFLRSAKTTESSPVQSIDIHGSRINVQAFTLPYFSRMTERQRKMATLPGPLRNSQGFYIYRAGRLVIWGTWFRLHPKSEGGKLARVKVDIPNDLDHLWSLDIKKSTAIPPAEVRDQLKRLAGAFVMPSEGRASYRGRKVKGADDVLRVWDVIVDRDTYRYQVNRDHPVLQRVLDGLDPGSLRMLEDALELIEEYFPAQDLVNRFSNDQVVISDDDEELIKRKLLDIWQSANGALGTQTEFVDWIVKTEPWDRYRATPEVLINLISESDATTGNEINHA